MVRCHERPGERVVLAELVAVVGEAGVFGVLRDLVAGVADGAPVGDACVACAPGGPAGGPTVAGGIGGPAAGGGDGGPSPGPDPDDGPPPDDFEPPDDWPPKPKTQDELFDDALDKMRDDSPLTPEERFEADQYSDSWDMSGDDGGDPGTDLGPPEHRSDPDSPDALDIGETVTTDLLTEIALTSTDELARTSGLATGTLGTLGAIASGSETAAKGYMAIKSSKGRGMGGGSASAQAAYDDPSMQGMPGSDAGSGSGGNGGSGGDGGSSAGDGSGGGD